MNLRQIFIFTLGAVLMFVSTDAVAQSEYKQKTKKYSQTQKKKDGNPFGRKGYFTPTTDFGVKAGANLSNISIDNELLKSKMQFGFAVGGSVEYRFNWYIAVAADLLYSMQGGTHTVEMMQEVGGHTFGAKADFTTTNHLLAAPLVFRVYPVGGLFIEGGLQLGINLKVNTKSTLTTILPPPLESPAPVSKDMDLESGNYEFFEFAVLGGIGYKFGNFSVSARYIYALTPFIKGVYGDFLSTISAPAKATASIINPDGYNTNIQICIGYNF